MLTSETRHSKLPWWTWIVPLPIFFLGTLISLEAKITTGTSLFYFPLPFALTLAYWWGPRVLPAFYLNATLCAGLWGLDRMELWLLYGLPEVVFVFLSWLLFVRIFSGNVWLPDTKQVTYFLLVGILVPLAIYKFMLESVFVLAGDIAADTFWNLFITTAFGDFVSAFCVSTPLLYFLPGLMSRKGLLVHREETVARLSPSGFTKFQWLELAGVALIAFAVNTFLGFFDYWFLNGVLSLYVAMRFGFGATVLINSYILVITYFIPAAIHDDSFAGHFLESSMLKTQLGTTLLYIFSIVVGRLVSDLNEKNKLLNHANSELDHFVYSVSHDLTAPLKSILGLVSLSRFTDKESDLRHQLDLIEKSVNKLELFVSEVLDYSKNKKMEVELIEVNLKDLSAEVFDELKYIEGADTMEMDNKGIVHETILSDRIRMKIILHNIISNAIKYRKADSASYVRLYTESSQNGTTLHIEDNGLGIKPDLQPRIFNMFFKGTDKSGGAGLGLYISKEVAKKINARISVESNFGQGSVFSIELN